MQRCCYGCFLLSLSHREDPIVTNATKNQTLRVLVKHRLLHDGGMLKRSYGAILHFHGL